MSRPRRRGSPGVTGAVDVVLSGVALAAAAPAMEPIVLALRRDLGAPVLFPHIGPEQDGEPVELVRFRTMRPQGGGAGDLDRMTDLGRRLCSTSLDQLTMLWNEHILGATIDTVLARRGVLACDTETMHEFLGTVLTEAATGHARRTGGATAGQP